MPELSGSSLQENIWRSVEVFSAWLLSRRSDIQFFTALVIPRSGAFGGSGRTPAGSATGVSRFTTLIFRLLILVLSGRDAFGSSMRHPIVVSCMRIFGCGIPGVGRNFYHIARLTFQRLAKLDECSE